MNTISLYDAFAGLLAYPGSDFHKRAARAADAVHLVILSEAQSLASANPVSVNVILSEAKDLASAAESLERFAKEIQSLSVEALQELFIQTFDMNPERSLEIGWHLFGENYDRGTFLVKMRQQLRRFGVSESAELPDHISHVLAVLARMPAQEAEEFALACVAPALEKISAGFGDKKEENVFKDVLDALAGLLRSRYGDALMESAAGAPALRVLQGSELR